MKKLLLSLVLLGLVLGAKADSISVSVTNAGAFLTNVINVPVQVNQVIISANTNATTVYLYDSKTNSLVYTNNAYQTISTTIGTLTNVYTNFLGTIQTNTYPGMTSVTVTNAASTNALNIVATLIIPANTTITYTPVGFYRFMNGITLTNTAGPYSASFSFSRW